MVPHVERTASDKLSASRDLRSCRSSLTSLPLVSSQDQHHSSQSINQDFPARRRSDGTSRPAPGRPAPSKQGGLARGVVKFKFHRSAGLARKLNRQAAKGCHACNVDTVSYNSVSPFAIPQPKGSVDKSSFLSSGNHCIFLSSCRP